MGSIINATSAYVEDNNSNKISLIKQKPFPDATHIDSLFKSTSLSLNNNGSYSNSSGNIYTTNITKQDSSNYSVSFQDLVNSPFNAVQFTGFYADYTTYSNQMPLQYQSSYSNNSNILISVSGYSYLTVTIPISALKPSQTYTATCTAGFSQNSNGTGGMNYCDIYYFSMTTDSTGMPSTVNFSTSSINAGSGNGTTWYPLGNGYYQFSNSNINDLAVQVFNNPSLTSYSNSTFESLSPQGTPNVNAIIY